MDPNQQSHKHHIYMIVFILIVSIGFLHTTKKYKPNSLLAGKEVIEDINTLTATQFYTYVEALLHTHNIHILSQVMTQLSIKKASQFLNLLFKSRQSPLCSDEKIELLFSMIAARKDKKEQFKLLEVISTTAYEQVTPLLILATQKGFETIIPGILEWSQRSDLSESHTYQHLIYEAFLYTIVNNNIHLFERLLRNNVPIYTEIAYKLLPYVEESHKSDFMLLFVQAQALLPYDTPGWLNDVHTLAEKNLTFGAVHSLLMSKKVNTL